MGTLVDRLKNMVIHLSAIDLFSKFGYTLKESLYIMDMYDYIRDNGFNICEFDLNNDICYNIIDVKISDNCNITDIQIMINNNDTMNANNNISKISIYTKNYGIITYDINNIFKNKMQFRTIICQMIK